MLDPNGRSRLRMRMPHAPSPAAKTSATMTRAPGGRERYPLRMAQLRNVPTAATAAKTAMPSIP